MEPGEHARDMQEQGLSLPTELLPDILCHIDYKARLTQCALVSRQFREAATAAVDTISIEPKHPQQLQQLAEWLSRHGNKLSHLEILWWGGSEDFHLSNFPVLATLRLKHLRLLPTADPSSVAADSPLSAFTELSRLVLKHCDIPSAVGGVAGLAMCSSLQHLQLDGHCDGFLFDESLGNALQHLTRLTNLNVTAQRVKPSAVAHLTALNRLQELTLQESLIFRPDDWQPASLPTLPSGLTSLNGRGILFNTVETCAAIRQLTQLRSLAVCGVNEFDFSVTSSMTQLTCLQFEPLEFYPLTSVLPVLRHLSCLQILKLTIPDGDSVLENPMPDQCAALTASTALGYLSITGTPLPAGAARHMFQQPSSGCHPFLETLCLGIDTEEEPEGTSRSFWPLDQPDDLRLLVTRCPMLHSLDLAGAVADGVDMSPLLQLQFLTNLSVGCEGTNDVVLRDVVAKMTRLRMLDIIDCGEVTDVGVCYLTKLTGLELLYVRYCPSLSWDLTHGQEGEGEEQEDVGEDGIYLDCKDVGSVTRQLQAICQRSNACLRIMLEERNRELQDVRQQLRAATGQTLEQETRVP